MVAYFFNNRQKKPILAYKNLLFTLNHPNPPNHDILSPSNASKTSEVPLSLTPESQQKSDFSARWGPHTTPSEADADSPPQ